MNALIESKGAWTALIATKGFRDELEIGRAIPDESSCCNIRGELLTGPNRYVIYIATVRLNREVYQAGIP
ncbi:MAG TPA: hypothetical protein GXX35_15575 [Thermoanaerobacterales bacterium]|nr:hypothetical protein [Thermoanaerobacterales bacterium]